MNRISLAPILCMQRDKDLLQYCLNQICIAEPVLCAGLVDLGKDMVYDTLVDQFKNHQGVLYAHITNQSELENFQEQLGQHVENISLAIINISMFGDISSFIHTLSQYRLKYTTKFTSIVFSNLYPLSSILTSDNDFLARSLKIIETINSSDCHILLADFARRFKYIVKQKQADQIYKLSGGHIGLIKSLYLYAHSNHKTVFSDTEMLISDGKIKARLQKIYQDLPQDTVQKLYKNGRLEQDFILNKFNLLHDGQFLCPLFIKYIKEKGVVNSDDNVLMQFFSSSELDVLSFLKENHSKLITREETAQKLWKEQWEENYSDWALDQIIHRIRKKIKTHKLQYRLKTKKGQGFILIFN